MESRDYHGVIRECSPVGLSARANEDGPILSSSMSGMREEEIDDDEDAEGHDDDAEEEAEIETNWESVYDEDEDVVPSTYDEEGNAVENKLVGGEPCRALLFASNEQACVLKRVYFWEKYGKLELEEQGLFWGFDGTWAGDEYEEIDRH